MKDRKDEEIQRKFAKGLQDALKKRGKSPEDAALLLGVELGTMYKYLKGDLIPGGQVLWQACVHLNLVLDERGFRVSRSRRHSTPELEDDAQYAFPFINESVAGKKISARVRRSNSSDYVQVSLRIKVAS